MKKSLLIIGILIAFSCVFAQKMQLRKVDSPLRFKSHPYTKQLIQNSANISKSKNPNWNRLLVILVDFQLESPDDPTTTGNGKFYLYPDPSYLYSVGAPPHNRQYFEANLEALRYYYKAVSAESYQLQYDVYPKNKAAYTLPKPMSYYNPPGASSATFLSRMEEYFKSSFETADQDDPEIDFGSYAHYMIIHAGSDWQHDIVGDTPSDLPSFYIRVSEGKEAVVDGGNVLISHACNVPSTISQDFSVETENGRNTYSGFGALNAVIAHEFGHSLGFVDLYNVSDFRPMVGSYDIMDSGGAGVMMDELENGDYVLIEGTLPTFPGAFSRKLVFGDYFRDAGYLKHQSELPAFSSINLHAVSSRQLEANKTPQIVQIPINDKEYLLVENRNVDPDGDGATALFGTLDSRVILYPTPLDDPTDSPSYEYDFMLPSFMKADGSSVGGGLLAWHVNERIIYDEGVTYSDGTWVSNFDNNSVNTSFYNRGVQVVEADGLTDLGSYYSMYWTGTPYDYFYARKPNLTSDGLFVSWSANPWKTSLNATTKPALLDSYGLAGLYGISDVSNPTKVMSFKISSGFFDESEVFSFPSPRAITAEIINSGFSDVDLPVLDYGNLNLLSRLNGDWQDLMGTYHTAMPYIDYAPQRADNNLDDYHELVVSEDNQLRFLDFSNVELATHIVSFPGVITTTPLVYDRDVYVSTNACLYKLQNYQIAGYVSLDGIKRIAGWNNKIVALGADYYAVIDTNTMAVIKQDALPEAFGNYEPLGFKPLNASESYVFLMANSGNIYRSNISSVTKIFTNHSQDIAGQLALAAFDDISPVLFFGIGNRLYAIKSDGSYLSGFPYTASKMISSTDTPRALRLDSTDLLYYPLQNAGYLAINKQAKAMPCYSMNWLKSTKQDYLYYNQNEQSLLWYYTDADGKLYLHTLEGISQNPIVFSGFRNANGGFFMNDFYDAPIATTELSAFVFPNPVKKPYYRVRLQNATGDSVLRIYDISGSLISKHQISASPNNPHDIEMDSSGLNPGVYIINIENSGKFQNIKFAVEK